MGGMVEPLLAIVLVLFVSYLVCRQAAEKKAVLPDLEGPLYYGLLPCYCFSCLIASPGTVALQELLFVLLASAIAMLVLFLIGYGCGQVLRREKLENGLLFALPECALLGIPVVAAVWGESQVPYAAAFFLGTGVLRLLLWKRQRSLAPQKLLPTALAMGIGLTFSCASLVVPVVVMDFAGYIGMAALPVMLFQTGARLYDSFLARPAKDSWLVVFFKGLVAPCIGFLLCRLLNLSGGLTALVCVLLSMPAQYGKREFGYGIFLSMVLVPAIYYLTAAGG